MAENGAEESAARTLTRAYYDSWKEGMNRFDQERLRSILAPDLRFEGPIAGRVEGAERFIRGLTGFVRSMHGIHFLQEVYAPDQAAVLYDAALPGGTTRFVEFFRVAGGRIAALTLFYDAHQYRELGGE